MRESFPGCDSEVYEGTVSFYMAGGFGGIFHVFLSVR